MQHYKPYWLYFPSFVVVLVGLVIYFWTATPDEQGVIDPQRPKYVKQESRSEASMLESGDVAR